MLFDVIDFDCNLLESSLLGRADRRDGVDVLEPISGAVRIEDSLEL